MIERDELKARFSSLNFHCNWALHARLTRSAAAHLSVFERAHQILRGAPDGETRLPDELTHELDRISKMIPFKKELHTFSQYFQMRPLPSVESENWVKFLFLYSRVISDIPLEIENPENEKSPDRVKKVVVSCTRASKPIVYADKKEIIFRVRWTVYPGTGEPGVHDVFNSFTR